MKQTGGRPGAEDTSPPEVRAWREQYCAEFLKTGKFNLDLDEKLRAYVRTQMTLDPIVEN